MTATMAEICNEMEPVLKGRLFHPTLTTQAELDAAIARFVKACTSNAGSDPVDAVNAALPELKVSNTAFWADGEMPLGAVAALNASVSMFLDGEKEVWVFVNVVPDGVAAKAGIVAGDVLAAIDETPVQKAPRFWPGKSYVLTIVDREGRTRNVSMALTRASSADRPPLGPAPPPAISSSTVRPGVGLLRISGFPGIIGVDFARDLIKTVRHLESANCSGFIVDLRSNHGGGLGSLRLMSLLTPKKIPVGHSLSRAARDARKPVETLPAIKRIPSTKAGLYLMALKFKFLHKDRSLRLITEGISRPLRERVVLLVDESTRGGAENVAGFAQANQLAMVVGGTTPGENLGAATFGIAQKYHLRIPLVGWFHPSGKVGAGVTPEYRVAPTLAGLRSGRDEVLERALELVQ